MGIVQLSDSSNNNLDYGRCLWALNNAQKAIKKMKSTGSTEEDTANLNYELSHSIEIIKKYNEFKNKLEADTLLEDTSDTEIISKFHTIAFLVKFFDKSNDIEKAKYYSEMIPKDFINRYLPSGILNKLGLGVNVPRPGTAAYVI